MPKVKSNLKLVQGFTLIELMIAIAIVAILATVGAVIFTNAQKNARDTKRRADIEAMAKAYEAKYLNNNKYAPLAGADFGGGSKPTDPSSSTQDYYNVLAQDGSGFQVCTALEAHPSRTCNSSSSTCYCKSSVQGTISAGQSLDGSSTDFGLGAGNSSLTHPASCDPAGTLDDGLVGYWRLDDTGSPPTTAADSSGNGFSGTYTNGATTANRDPLQTNNVVTGSFDGSNDFINIGNIQSELNLISTTPPSFSISAWFKPAVGGNDLSGISLVNGYYARLYYRTSNTFGFQLVPGTTGVTSGAITLNQWYFVVGAYDSTSNKVIIYVRGVGVQSGNNATPGSTNLSGRPMNMLVGNAQQYFKGLIDDVRIYNRALTPQEVTNLYGSSGAGCIP